MSVLASVPMQKSAVLLNDSARSVYTYAIQLPLLIIAYDELMDEFDDNNIPVVNAVSNELQVPVGTTTIIFGGTPALPNDIIEPAMLYERPYGQNVDFKEMRKYDWLPETVQQLERMNCWSWKNNAICMPGATAIVGIRIHYIGDTQATITSENSVIPMGHWVNFLAFRTAGLVAEFIEENKDKAMTLNNDAAGHLATIINMATKARQVQPARRRPFRASYKMRGGL
jgi:hypothetical protein